MVAVSIKRFLSFILLCFTVQLYPFFDDFFSFIGFDDGYAQHERYSESSDLQFVRHSYSSAISPNLFQSSFRAIRLPDVTGTKRLPGLYHLESYARVPEQYGWQCGLHMLYNMCEVERFLGISDITDDEFIYECERIPRVFEEAGSYPVDLKQIARKTSCCPLYIVEHDDHADRIDILYESETESRFWAKIRAQLEQPGIRCVHFGCLIYAQECHIFLISIVKMLDGTKALYLLDNVNRDEPSEAQYQMFRHAEYIHKHVFGKESLQASIEKKSVAPVAPQKKSGKKKSGKKSGRR